MSATTLLDYLFERKSFDSKRSVLLATLLLLFAIVWFSAGVRAQSVTSAAVSQNHSEAASVGNYVWEDTNVDGVQGFQPAENPIAGVVVSLFHANGLLADMTITDGDGEYSFQFLVPGEYYLGFTAPRMMVATVMNRGDDSDLDSDIDPITGLTPIFSLAAGEKKQDIDVGFTHAASIASWVWQDLNMDGVFDDEEESGIPAAVVTLYDEANQVILNVPTDVNGYFVFPSVTPGTYSIGVTPPPGMTFTVNAELSGSSLTSNVNPLTGRMTPFVVHVGPNTLEWGIGLTPILAPTSLQTIDEPLEAAQSSQAESKRFLPLISHTADYETEGFPRGPYGVASR